VRRNDDLVREILLQLEASDQSIFHESSKGDGATPQESQRRHYHRELMKDAGLITYSQKSQYRLTNAGHDYLEAIRDEGIWIKTKSAVLETGGNATLEILKQLASGLLRKQIEDRTGIKL